MKCLTGSAYGGYRYLGNQSANVPMKCAAYCEAPIVTLGVNQGVPECETHPVRHFVGRFAVSNALFMNYLQLQYHHLFIYHANFCLNLDNEKPRTWW